MNAPVILDFDHSVGFLEPSTTIALSDWQEDIRFGCSKQKYHQLKQYIEYQLPETYGTVLMGSGDYHHVSLLLIEQLAAKCAQTPIEVVIFDNHPDNMRYLFGIHCGSWVSYVASLSFVKHVHVVGITSNDIGLAHSWENRLKPLYNNKLSYWSMDVNVSWAKRVGLSKAFRSFTNPEELMVSFISYLYQSSSPVYLSIDKDVLNEDSVKTNWDQGKLEPYHILDTISALNNRIIGSDITGDVSIWQYQSKLKRFLSSLDEQPPVSEEVLKLWQSQQHEVNMQFIEAINKNN